MCCLTLKIDLRILGKGVFKRTEERLSILLSMDLENIDVPAKKTHNAHIASWGVRRTSPCNVKPSGHANNGVQLARLRWQWVPLSVHDLGLKFYQKMPEQLSSLGV
jgi:hypothetical protein